MPNTTQNKEELEELRHFHDTNIGLMATDKSIEHFNSIVSEAMRGAVGCLGYEKLTGDLEYPILMIAQQKIQDLMWKIEPIKSLKKGNNEQEL